MNNFVAYDKIPAMIRKHKIRFFIGLIIVLAIGFVIYRTTRPPVYDHYTVVSGKINQEVNTSGKIVAEKSVSLAFPAGSKVTWVGVKKGDQVKKWQTLATIDARELEKNIKIKLLDYMKTRWDFEQTRDDNNVRGRELNTIGLTEAERRILEKSQFGLDQSVLDYEIAHLALEKSVLVSPIAGTVTETSNLLAGENLLTAEAPNRIIKVTDLKSVYYQAEVEEVDFSQIKIGMAAKIALDSFPEASISGTVTYIGQEGVKTTGGGVQILVDIAINPPMPNLVPELTGDVTIITLEKAEVLVTDKRFLTKTNEGYTALVWKNGKAETRTITVGVTNDRLAEVVSGLAEGEDLVTLAVK
jgi:RND family efflux transporter MFP subunit